MDPIPTTETATLDIVAAQVLPDALPPFGAPRAMEATGPVHPGGLGVLSDGSVYYVFVNQANTEVHCSYNTGPGTPFADKLLDQSPNQVGNVRVATDALGRIHAAWYQNLSDGSGDAIIYYARKDPGTPAGVWTKGPAAIVGSRTVAKTEGAYKVVGLACQPDAGRVAVLWSRNGVGGKYTTSDDGITWAPVQVVPGPFGANAADMDIGFFRSGVVSVAWMNRDPTGGVVAKLHTDHGWSPLMHISQGMPGGGQAYTPRLVGTPDGNLLYFWTGPSTDGFCRVYDRVRGLLPTITRLWQDAGGGNSRGIEATADAAGMVHVVFDDDSGRLHGDLATLYLRGSGATWSAPINVFPSFGAYACCRYPGVAVAGKTIYVTTNTNAPGTFINYVAAASLP